MMMSVRITIMRIRLNMRNTHYVSNEHDEHAYYILIQCGSSKKMVDVNIRKLITSFIHWRDKKINTK